MPGGEKGFAWTAVTVAGTVATVPSDGVAGFDKADGPTRGTLLVAETAKV